MPLFREGDAFTDDTAAIQAAIDAVHEQGGGTVILPGRTGKSIWKALHCDESFAEGSCGASY